MTADAPYNPESTEDYIPRTLSFVDAQGETQEKSEAELAGLGLPFVVLGEPGMGKTELLKTFAQGSEFLFITAKKLLRTPANGTFSNPRQVLVIDALDEVASARADDPVQQVLRQLAALGYPRFVLSCRSADWRSAIAKHDIAEDYGRTPLELRLNPLSRDDAVQWLTAKLESDRAREIIDGLVRRSLEALFGNPLTLSLIARLALQSGDLPDTRAELFAGACDKLLVEQNPGYSTAALNNLTREDALGAAGAACASLLLTGSEAISQEVSGLVAEGDLRAVDIAILPGGEAVEAVLHSRLFQRPGASDRLTPLHRSIAEYLGARWLAAQIDSMSSRRLLALLTYNGGVPASLRGLHAWLAHFSPSIAMDVIQRDPYGVLRYGDADHLTTAQGERLLDALKTLSVTDPYFRSEDWSRHTARGITQPALVDKVKALVLSPTSEPQLRSLLLDALKGSEAAVHLSGELFTMLMTDGAEASNYAERIGAAEALVGLKDPARDWQAVVETLSRRPSPDAHHLAIDIMITVGLEAFGVEVIVDAVLGYLGRLPDLDASFADVESVGPLYFLARHVPAQHLASVLDRFFERNPTDSVSDWNTSYALDDFINTLIARLIAHEAPEPMPLLMLLRSRQTTVARGKHRGQQQKTIGEYIRTHADLRRAIQEHVLLVEIDHHSVQERAWRLQHVDAALVPDADDVVALLASDRLAILTDSAVREMWKDVVRIGAAWREGLPETVSNAAGALAAGDAELEAFLEDLRHPGVPEWEVNQRERDEAESRQREVEWAKHRQDFVANIAHVRAGDLGRVLPLAQAYLGYFDDMDAGASPHDRVRQWLGDEVLAAALEGFEAVLHRADLPTSAAIAESYGQSKRWNFITPVLVGLLERVATGRGLETLPQDVILSGLLGCEWEYLGNGDEGKALKEALDVWLAAHPEAFETYARLLVEPQLKKPKDTPCISGLYQLTRHSEMAPTVTALCQDWLSAFPDMPASAEIELIDHLIRFEDWPALNRAAAARRDPGYRDDEHRLTWLTIEFLVDFERFQLDLGAVAAAPNLMWHIRNRGVLKCVDLSTDGGLARCKWLVRTFRGSFGAVPRPTGVTSGNENPWDATDFLYGVIGTIAADTSDHAIAALTQLRDEVHDGYTDRIRNAQAEQIRARREADFTPPSIADIASVLTSAPPKTVQDLKATALDRIERLQRQVRGDDVNTGSMFYDGDKPCTENRCRDVFTALLRADLLSEIEIVPERLMPKGKRADLALQIGALQVPVEAKGQWNRDLWSAVVEQLDGLYTKEWRASGVGIYLVFWFGADVPDSRRLKAPPTGAKPRSPAELATALAAHIPEHRRSDLSIVVFDASR